MKNKLWALFFAAMLAVIGYVMVSSAAKHTELDNRALYQWRLENAVRP